MYLCGLIYYNVAMSIEENVIVLCTTYFFHALHILIRSLAVYLAKETNAKCMNSVEMCTECTDGEIPMK